MIGVARFESIPLRGRAWWLETMRREGWVRADSLTCLAICAGIVSGDGDVPSIRAQMSGAKRFGERFAALSRYLKARVPFVQEEEGASLADLAGWLRGGDVVIVDGGFGPTPHPIVVFGVEVLPLKAVPPFLDPVVPPPLSVQRLSFLVMDAWGELYPPRWSYPVEGGAFSGAYGPRVLVAACGSPDGPATAAWRYRRLAMSMNRPVFCCHRVWGVA